MAYIYPDKLLELRSIDLLSYLKEVILEILFAFQEMFTAQGSTTA